MNLIGALQVNKFNVNPVKERKSSQITRNINNKYPTRVSAKPRKVSEYSINEAAVARVA